MPRMRKRLCSYETVILTTIQSLSIAVGRTQWTGGESACARPGRPEFEEFATRPRGAESGNHRGETDLLRRSNPRSRSRTEEPRQGDYRGFHDCSQRRDRLAREHNFTLPEDPDSKALDEFLVREKAADPLGFPDLSLAVIKLLGSGEYVAEAPGDVTPGHFGLAVQDYAHFTAPNRRCTDLITQRLLKAAIAGQATPYRYAELDVFAKHFTEEEDAANKVERQVDKSAAALLLQSRIGEQFDAIVTGASPKGTWARLLTIPVEGRVVHGF